jgi:hypothetical protein
MTIRGKEVNSYSQEFAKIWPIKLENAVQKKPESPKGDSGV